ncbi:DNA polymerase III delta subunit [Ruminiclostridium sufflavum DSM 19573]|uniref:DNA polymerase III subunit delta n=1 Tax=Ruminiclostridium sufflavum DSM 19573 TaxID=1121337 RepID=A0A318XXB8_9FIRM|nr:DNA polymerase III subunit delta [Ruminiclostridium sufflavum]PYG87416.1 DNA polymerase III delta subunit [Ruminiclostridium sufflavum DSM 19573]
MSIDILKKQIKENKLQNIYLFHGAEEYLIKYYINAVQSLIVSEENSELNYIFFDGKTEEAAIIANCETMPIFSDKKLVVIKNSGLFKARKGDNDGGSSGKKAAKDTFSAYLENMPPYTCLIMVETAIDKRLKLVGTIKKYGLIVEFDFQKPADLVKWVTKVFGSYKKSIDRMAASYLVENSDYSMTELLNEIEKVVNFVGQRSEIVIKDIEEVCSKSIKSRIFDLTDAISEGNISKALNFLNDMAALKEPMQKVLFMIIRQIRMLYRIKLMRQKGMREDLVSKQLGLTPYVASKVMNISKSLDISVLEGAMYYSLELDEAIKTGRISDRVAIELLIASMG